MTTEQIRKSIHVKYYGLSDTGIFITYFRESRPDENTPKAYKLNPVQTLQVLERIGSITKFDVNPIKVWWETPKGTSVQCGWDEFHSTFTLSQYEAITLVVRHEYDLSLKSDMNMLEIDKALESLR